MGKAEGVLTWALYVCNHAAVFQQARQLWVANAVLLGNLRRVAEAMGLPWTDAEGAAMPSLAGLPLVLDAGHQAADGAIPARRRINRVDTRGQLVQVRHVDSPRSQQTQTPHGVVGQAQRLQRARAREDFVEQNEAVRRGLPENLGQAYGLLVEVALPRPGTLDAREMRVDRINRAHARGPRRHVQAGLEEEMGQPNGARIRRLPAPVRPRQDPDPAVLRVERHRVGDDPAGRALP